MEDNERNGFSIDKENLKNETTSTINQVRETIKTVNFKDDTAETKGFLMELFKNPIEKIKYIANSDNKHLKTAIFMIILWTIAVFISTLGRSGLEYFFKNFISRVELVISPALGIIVMSLIVLTMNRTSKKSLASIITTVTISKAPTILASFISILTILSSGASQVTSPISSFCSVISTILLYFGIKELYNSDEDNSFIKTFIVIEGIYFIARFALSFLGVHI